MARSSFSPVCLVLDVSTFPVIYLLHGKAQQRLRSSIFFMLIFLPRTNVHLVVEL